MATQIVVGDILTCRAWTQLDEQGAVNSYDVECISITGAGVTDLQLAQFFDADMGTYVFYKALCPATVEYRGIQVYFLQRSGGVLVNPVSTIANAGVGGAAGNPLPRNTCPILKRATNLRGPAGRGRVFLPFAAQIFCASNGRPTVAMDTLVNSYASNLITLWVVGSGPNTSSFSHILTHRPKGGPVTSRGAIITCESADKFGQMHKRGDYGRANASPI
jgi:hypothetical protein